ncbi:transcriptional antiterminator, BglG family [Caloramator quimbayensis]|uniref:Transcriptional antiterminator, BglG family n=1 Tax=Caloramator quimbayensis TaxID=1147123 RepID=A0A1T4XY36_9CLOT|nr:BglG family transcription antiterminator [Caloramator quimbayensis]SKA93911.1 transcriptional antiterminator, BglG family [Caloramator quimbayensis]
MQLNKRSVEILNYLFNADGFVKIEDIAKHYKLTDRAVRYNIDKIEEFLVENGFSYFEREYNRGIRIKKDDGLEEFIRNLLSDKNIESRFQYTFSKDERIKYTAIKLLQSSQPLKVSYFQELFFISKNTMLKELDELEEYLKKSGLKLVRKQKYGIYIEGSESQRRKLAKELVFDTLSYEDILNYMSTKMDSNRYSNFQFDILFSDIDIDFIDSLIKMAESELLRKFSDEAYGGLLTHLAIMIKRIQLKKDVYALGFVNEDLKDTKEYEVSTKMIKRIEEKFNISVPQEEIEYIALHLLGAKVIKNKGAENEDINKGLYDVALKMTEEIEKIYGIDFKDLKSSIVEGLVLHLRPSLYRIKYNFKLLNPVYEDVRSKYNELFLNVKKVSRYIEEFINSPIDEHEISYITLHFGAALERVNMNLNHKPRVVIVCGSGLGTAKMIASKIESEFNVEIVDTISSREVENIETDYDYIISTIDIGKKDGKKNIKVSPLLTSKDYEKLEEYFNYKSKRLNDNNDLKLVNRLIYIVEKYADIPNRELLQYEFLHELKNYKEFSKTWRYIYMLKDLITWKTILLNAECSTWQEAIKLGTDILSENNYVDDRYYDAIMENFKNIGPYMVVAPGIVLSHARPEDGVKKLSMSLVTLKNPVNFGSELNDPVKLIITIAAIDNESHLKALSQLMELFMNSNDMNEIYKAKTKEEIINIVTKYSK